MPMFRLLADCDLIVRNRDNGSVIEDHDNNKSDDWKSKDIWEVRIVYMSTLSVVARVDEDHGDEEEKEKLHSACDTVCTVILHTLEDLS